MTLTNQKPDFQYRNILLALLAGAGAGLAAGLLLAPKSGDNLRANIGAAVDDGIKSARQKADDLRDSATDAARRGLKEVRKSKDNAAEKVNDTVASVRDTVDRAMAAVLPG